ncbi:heparan-alpha-glucosaminide N-acetyltransferase domain-containing protein [Lyngbya aestuarii]|uniref:heparan-alpha-glucosaminide N-acetyltransferase domain-containing protein n=1 Tax=Lyngbya aestuarii TaxID=118322 RepID=UPI00403DCE10
MRLTCLDVFRGIAITGMVLVNNPGSWSHVYPPLLHAEWHGFTPTDLVFPAFLFIAGVAIAFSFAKYTQDNQPPAEAYWRIGRRAAILFSLGLLLNGSSIILDWLLKGSPLSELGNLRIMGVLQRISLAYLLAALVVLKLPRRGVWILAVVTLLAYWIAMSLIPIPGYGAGNLTPEGNLAAYIDRAVLGTNHLYQQAQFDPEGLFSTLPALVTVLAGYFAGDWLRHQPIKSRTSLGLVIFGITCLVLGWTWGLLFPINKQLWTSSYVVYSAGWSLLVLACCYELIEVQGIRRWGWPFEVMGLNAIFVFVASGLVVRILYRLPIGTGKGAINAYGWIYEHLFQSWAGAMNGSLIFAIVNVLFWWLILYGMYRKGWFIKI